MDNLATVESIFRGCGSRGGSKGEELGNEAYAMCSESMDNCIDQVYAYDVSFER